MEKQQVIFFRNLLLRALVVAAFIVFLYLVLTLTFWDTWVSMLRTMFKLDEQESARVFVDGLTNLRILIAFFIVIPTIALHWTSKTMKE